MYSYETLTKSHNYDTNVYEISNAYLTHWGRVTYMRQWSNHHWIRYRLVAWSAPSHYLNQCWSIVHWNLTNKIQRYLKTNSHIFIQENAFEMSPAFLSQPQCLKTIPISVPCRRPTCMWKLFHMEGCSHCTDVTVESYSLISILFVLHRYPGAKVSNHLLQYHNVWCTLW